MVEASTEREREARAEEHARSLYLDLMKRALLNVMYGDKEEKPFSSSRVLFWRWLGLLGEALGVRLSWPRPMDVEKRAAGREWPPTAHTMIGMKRLENVESCAREFLARDVPGDFIETGVWRGGTTIFMRAVLKAFQVTDRRVWVADSFEGLPPPDVAHPADATSRGHRRRRLKVSLEEVRRNFERYGLLDEQVRFLKGWFHETLPAAPIERLAILRLDGDLYGSTMDALENLYPKLSVGGFVIVDDYGAIPACREAVADYRRKHGITEEIVPIDWTGMYWKRLS